ncbi:hypothetical protein [uncultured Methylibium sp.]|uniref:hypothetical protein n=1 Tax=uncultured Methylibium sp. TaxID=381093 RepID=UPI0025E97FF7|nr:hypothetical protein [uncultured Methylibium sp.]
MSASADTRPAGRGVAAAALLGLTLLAGGCAQMPLGAPVASLENIQRARVVALQPLALGSFGPAADQERALVDHSLRGSSIVPPQGSFAAYLRQTLETELAAAGLLDPASTTVVSATLLASRVDAAVGEGRGMLAARFVHTRDGRTRYDRELQAEGRWPSSFVGVEALPAAFNGYALLHRELVGRLLADPDFRQAAAR